jgi:hypothetical protein
METSRKKALELMQTAMVTYRLILDGWQVGHQIGDGYDIMAIKDDYVTKIELKAIDLAAIADGKNATQHLSANEIVHASHLVISVFEQISLKTNLVMTVRQFLEASGVKKYKDFSNHQFFMDEYKRLSKEQSAKRKGSLKSRRLDFDFAFNPKRFKDWKLSIFIDQWKNLENL